jgi:transposase
MSKRDELYARKQQAMELMNAGHSWQEANEQSGLNYSRQGVQRLYREWQDRGDEALEDNRHGHPYKVTDKVKEWLVDQCQNEPEAYAPQLVAKIEAEFEVELHHDYVNLLRNQLGLPAPKVGRPRQKESKQPSGEQRPQGDFSPGDKRGTSRK